MSDEKDPATPAPTKEPEKVMPADPEPPPADPELLGDLSEGADPDQFIFREATPERRN